MAKKSGLWGTCTQCGKTLDKVDWFYFSESPMYKNNDNRMHICKQCVWEEYNRFAEFYGDEEKALYRLSLLLDFYFDSNILNTIYMNAKKTNVNLAKVYMQKINVIKSNRCKTSLDSQYFIEDKELVNNEQVKENIKKESPISVEMLRRWGKGLPEEDYSYLEEKYQELISVYDHRSPVQRTLYENMSRTQLEAEKARKLNNLPMYEKMISTLSKLMADGNIKPVQENAVNDDEACFGQFINKIENEEPIPEPLDFFKDVDGFRKYVTEWFVKPFAKVFDLDSNEPNDEDGESDDDEDEA